MPKPKINHATLQNKLKKYSPDLAKFILDSLLIDPRKRLISSELLQHSYFNNKSWLDDYLVKLKSLVSSHEASIAKLNLNKITTQPSLTTPNENSVKPTPIPPTPALNHTTTNTNTSTHNHYHSHDEPTTHKAHNFGLSIVNSTLTHHSNTTNHTTNSNVNAHLPSVSVSPVTTKNVLNTSFNTNTTSNTNTTNTTSHNTNVNSNTDGDIVLTDLKNANSVLGSTTPSNNNQNATNNNNNINKLNLTFASYQSDSKASFTSTNNHDTAATVAGQPVKKHPPNKLVSLPRLRAIRNFNAKKALQADKFVSNTHRTFSPISEKFSDLNLISPPLLSNWNKTGIKVRLNFNLKKKKVLLYYSLCSGNK